MKYLCMRHTLRTAQGDFFIGTRPLRGQEVKLHDDNITAINAEYHCEPTDMFIWQFELSRIGRVSS